MMSVFLTTMPTEDQILDLYSVAEAKLDLRISHTIEDTLIERCIMAAYDYLAGANGWLNRPILATGYTMYLSGFDFPAEIPRPPFVSVTSVKYYLNDVLETVPSTVYGYRTIAPAGYGSIYLKPDQTWPGEYDARTDTVQLEYESGFGDADYVKANHPALVRALSSLALDLFRNREDTFVDIRMVEIDRNIVNNSQKIAGRYKIYNRIK